MTRALATFKLCDHPGGAGVSCDATGLRLAGVSLLREVAGRFEPRPSEEIDRLFQAAYGAGTPSRLGAGLRSVVRALNAGETERAMVAALGLRLPPLRKASAEALAIAENALARYSNEEPRDWHGRWTTGGGSSGIDRDTSARPSPAKPRQRRVAAQRSPDSAKPKGRGDEAEGTYEPDPTLDPRAIQSKAEALALLHLYPSLVGEFDVLGPVEFSKRVTKFGEWLERQGRNFSPEEQINARAQYDFLQNRLSFWIGYKYKSAIASENILSASSRLYQGAVNGGIVDPAKDDLPPSMLAVAAGAMQYDGPGPSIRVGRLRAAPESDAEISAPLRLGDTTALGGVVDGADAGIVWGKDITRQGFSWQNFNTRRLGLETELLPGAKTFDNFNPKTGKAASAKTLDTTTYTYASQPAKVYSRVAKYIDDVANYSKPRAYYDVDPALIRSREVDLAIPEETAPAQWLQLQKAVAYAKDRKVFLVITRIRTLRPWA